LSRGTDCNNNPDIGNKGNKRRIIIECAGKSLVRKFISLPYDDSSAIQLNAAHPSESHSSIKSTRVSSAPILRAIENSEELITSEDDLLSFLSHTKFSTFGIFKLGEKSHLVMLIPEKYTSNISYSCHLLSTP